MFINRINRDRKTRKKDREDWMWYEDPYMSDTRTGLLNGYGHGAPAPAPKFGTEPPMHTGVA